MSPSVVFVYATEDFTVIPHHIRLRREVIVFLPFLNMMVFADTKNTGRERQSSFTPFLHRCGTSINGRIR